MNPAGVQYYHRPIGAIDDVVSQLSVILYPPKDLRMITMNVSSEASRINPVKYLLITPGSRMATKKKEEACQRFPTWP